MEWLVRFLLNLPARPQDIEQIRQDFPEVLNSNRGLDDRRFRHLRHLYFMLDAPDWWELHKELRDWIRNSEHIQRSSFPSSSIESCPDAECPLKQQEKSQPENLSSDSTDETPPVLDMVCAAGGPNRKPPKDEFFNLVRRVHHSLGIIKEVILTDPYIYADIGEDGQSGGFNNLIEYLETLGLTSASEFTLKINPNPKRYSDTSKKVFQKVIRKHFPKVKFDTYKSRYVFHDRFYIVRDGHGQLKGTFGPSLNGLSSNSIVLMGEIEKKRGMERLAQWL